MRGCSRPPGARCRRSDSITSDGLLRFLGGNAAAEDLVQSQPRGEQGKDKKSAASMERKLRKSSEPLLSETKTEAFAQLVIPWRAVFFAGAFSADESISMGCSLVNRNLVNRNLLNEFADSKGLGTPALRRSEHICRNSWDSAAHRLLRPVRGIFLQEEERHFMRRRRHDGLPLDVSIFFLKESRACR